MKMTTLNFWCGVYLGACSAILIPEYYKKFKKRFGKVEEQNDISKSNVDTGGISDSDGSENDQPSIPKQNELYKQISSIYRSTDVEPIDASKIEAGKLDVDTILTVNGNRLIVTNKSNKQDYIVYDDTPLKINKNYFGSSGVDSSILNGNYPTASDIETDVKE